MADLLEISLNVDISIAKGAFSLCIAALEGDCELTFISDDLHAPTTTTGARFQQ